jgi:predicted nucleotidyltransferase
MLKTLQKYAAWKIITFFLDHPSSAFYVRQVAENLDLSTYTASRILYELENHGLLSKEAKARAIFYSLNDIPMVRALKRYHILAKLHESKMVQRFLNIDEDIYSLTLYGSYASGEYDERSDLDVICITDKTETEFVRAVRELEKILKVEINVKIFSPSTWRKIAEKDRQFYDTVIRNHIIIHGTPLVIE